MKIGARDLLNEFSGSQSAVAEAYVRGHLPQHLAPFVLDTVTDHQIAVAREKLDRTEWQLEARVAKLEEEMRELQRQIAIHFTWS